MDEEKVTPTPAEEPVEKKATEETAAPSAEGAAQQTAAPAKKQNVFDKRVSLRSWRWSIS